MNKIKVENSSSLYRDQESGAILNCSDTEYNAYLDLKKRRMVELSDLETQGIFSDIRSAGLWIGCDLVDKSANEVLDQAYEQGLILVSAGSNCLRLAPALNIPNSEIEKGVEILNQVLLGE